MGQRPVPKRPGKQVSVSKSNPCAEHSFKMSILRLKEMAAYLKCSERHVIDLKNQRLIPHIKMGRSVRYCLEDVQKALRKLTVAPVE